MACKLIVFEGLDNCGKDTQISKLRYRLQATGIPTKSIDSVTDTNIGFILRNKTFDELADPRQLVSLFIADYYNKLKEIKYIMSTSDSTLILCNRWYYSTLAYCNDTKLIPAIELMCKSDIKPDVTYLLDITPEESIKRQKSMNKKKDVYSKQDILTNASYVYSSLAKDENNNIVVLDGTDTVGLLQVEIISDLTSRGIIKKRLRHNDRW